MQASINLGPVAIDFPITLAPLSGYSDRPMRIICRRLGAAYTVCEVLLDRFVIDVTTGRKADRYVHVADEDHPVGVQLLGSLPHEFAAAALKLVEAGFDVVDLNFGCPVKKVVGKRRGGYLLSRPERALAIVARVRDSIPPRIPVTIKMRRGMDDSSQSRDAFFEIFDGAFRLGAAAITVHGRTVRQRYDGPSSWEFLKQVKQLAPDKTVLGSGDLFTAGACLEMIQATGVDGVTVARGAIGNPWIFQQARALAAGRPLPPPPGLFEQREVIGDHYRLAEEIYGPRRTCNLMRKFGIKYSRLHPRAKEVRAAFVTAASPSQWQEVLHRWYAEDRPGCYPAPEG